MNIEMFIPDRLKEARALLGLSQAELAKAVSMQQKDISLHENKTTKVLIPVRYLSFLHTQGIDLNSLFGNGPVQLRGTPTLRNPLVESARLATQDQMDAILKRLARLEAAQKGATSPKRRKAG